ncbi:hypothetical protein [Sphingomonas sp. BK069]|uniref:hypothetical protein n=1 Tax=Sphingomonas sp. BK069 TaxID=2586979 RepID=UPI00160C301C|nr:hypothetical protein [Sphingomonas sp. BK069]MBB3349124.1 hypothetical protein [Sphingomonas sp. BK069]
MLGQLTVMAYGGPAAGTLVSLDEGAVRHVVYDERITAPFVAPHHQAPAMSRFPYVLVHTSDGISALVPERDNDLLLAFQQNAASLGARESDVLSVEVHRRGLDFSGSAY